MNSGTVTGSLPFIVVVLRDQTGANDLSLNRKRKVRCSGEWPSCTFCTGRGQPCVYEGHPAENGGSTNGCVELHSISNGFLLTMYEQLQHYCFAGTRELSVSRYH
jgi:hypothetical protein